MKTWTLAIMSWQGKEKFIPMMLDAMLIIQASLKGLEHDWKKGDGFDVPSDDIGTIESVSLLDNGGSITRRVVIAEEGQTALIYSVSIPESVDWDWQARLMIELGVLSQKHLIYYDFVSRPE
jgi:hypothetical protein